MRRVLAVLLIFSGASVALAQETPTPAVVIVITPTSAHTATETPTATPTFTETPPGWDVVAFATMQIGEGEDAQIQRVAFRYEITAGEAAIVLFLALLLTVKLVEVLTNIWNGGRAK